MRSVKISRVFPRRATLTAGAFAAFAAAANPVAADPVTGNVLDGATLRPIPDAVVTAAGTEGGTGGGSGGGTAGRSEGVRATTHRAGDFTLDLPPGTAQLTITAPGYEDGSEPLEVPAGGVNGAVLLLFRPGAASEVIEVQDKAPAPPPPNRQSLRREVINRIPGSRGDALQSVRSLPGVAATSRGGPGLLVIRGASPEDSRITIDGIEVPLIYHFFGLQSILPSEFISSIEFTPGGFGVEEGRATGGIINVVTRDDVVPKAEGFAELSFINLAALVQAPVSKKHHVQVSAAIRRSIIDFILPAVIPKDTLNFTAAPTYYDGQLRLDWRPSDRDRFSLFTLTSLDNLSLINNTIDPNDPVTNGATFENETSFTRTIASWTHGKNDLVHRLTLSASMGGFRFAIADRFLKVDQTTAELRNDLNLKLSDKVRLRAGTHARSQAIDLDVKFPAQPTEGQPPATSFSSLPLVIYNKQVHNDVAAAYAAIDVKPVPKALVTAGLRYDYYDHIGQATLSPRGQASYQLSEALTVKGSVGEYSRGLQQGEAVPTNLRPERATQLVMGLEHQTGDGISTTGSLFYTDRRDLVVRDPLLGMTDPLNAYVNDGTGRSYGAELLVRVQRPTYFGWAAYTYSRSNRVDQPGGARRLFDADQPHNLIVVASKKLGRWEFGGRFQYSTGTPETPITGALYLADTNTYIPTYGTVNSARIEDGHALDLRIDRRWTWGAFKMSAYLDITNVYAHARVLGYSYNYDFTERQAITELPIVPTIGLRGAR
jgi:TonB dependent receptor/Carboxypeptidase regulatory-like domain/TonB-dependent Receptor Plug Domain